MKPVWQLACGLQPAFGAAFGIMGIVNCTNDSFYEAARTPSADQAIARARKLLAGELTSSTLAPNPQDLDL